eukprot:TRINITY_DN1584_c0_g1_i4.p1 TRINITY_DN1584_c0_g1~~TRINITY_DN1584_c0_g1_i4.p1  ORF type:complete len:273 (-),score=59.23 TRINITY_DN1584_c0_g1_i4:117-842(-)
MKNGLRSGNVIELYGGNGTGKTETLMLVIISCIFPKKWKDINFGGSEACFIIYDNDYHLDILRLSCIMEYKAKSILEENELQVDLDEMEEFIASCLERLHVIRCRDSFEFCMSLKVLPNLIQTIGEVKVLAIDSLSALFWLDKQHEEIGRLRQQRIFKMVCSIVHEYNLLLIFTKQILFTKSDREHLYQGWTDLVQNRFLFTKESSLTDNEKRYEFSAKMVHPNSNVIHRFKISDSGVSFV